ncbi:unnamed protein product [[Candida] boidinii]|nr:unnamed protein product [[Candida] boidinii]
MVPFVDTLIAVDVAAVAAADVVAVDVVAVVVAADVAVVVVVGVETGVAVCCYQKHYFPNYCFSNSYNLNY